MYSFFPDASILEELFRVPLIDNGLKYSAIVTEYMRYKTITSQINILLLIYCMDE